MSENNNFCESSEFFRVLELIDVKVVFTCNDFTQHNFVNPVDN